MKPPLRKYQSDNKDTLREAFKTHNRVVDVLATGAGKTVIFSSIADDAARRGKRVMVLVHRQEILEQTVKKLVTFGVTPGVIQGDLPMTTNPVQVAMVQSLINRLPYMDKLPQDLIISDECHHGVSDTWKTIFNHWPRAKVLGVTATPKRTDGRGLAEIFTAMVQGPQTPDLVYGVEDWDGKHHAFLTPPAVHCSPSVFLTADAKHKIKNGEYDKDVETEIMGQKVIVNDAVEIYRKHFNGAPCIVFGASVADCDTVAAALRADGWTAGVLKDRMDPEERKRYTDGIGNGTLNVLLSYDIISEGYDVPVVFGCIIRRKTTSLTIWLQQVGRVLRQYPGKKFAPVFDQVGNVLSPLGHPMERRLWTLDGAVKRVDDGSSDEDEEAEKSGGVRQCGQCSFWYAGNPVTCPICGAPTSDSRGMKDWKYIDAPMELIPPPPVDYAMRDRAEILEYPAEFREQAAEDKVRREHVSDRGRLDEMAKLFGLGRTWTDRVWRKYVEAGR